MSKKVNRSFVPVDQAPGVGLSARARELLALVLIGTCLYLLLALATFQIADPGQAIPRGWKNLGGELGYLLAHAFVFVFGGASFVLVSCGLLWGLWMFARGPVPRATLKVMGALLLTVIASIWLAGANGTAVESALFPEGPGGRFGANLSPRLTQKVGGSGRALLLLFGLLIAILLATEWLISTLIHRASARLERFWTPAPVPAAAAGGAIDARRPAAAEPRGDDAGATPAKERGRAKAAPEPKPESKARAEAPAKTPLKPAVEPEPLPPPPPPKVEPEPAPVRVGPPRVTKKPPKPKKLKQQPLPLDAAYPFPPLELFRESVYVDDANTQTVIDANAEAIEKRLLSFKIGSKVVGVAQGPAVTQYELSVQEGIKVSRIVAYEADLAAALRAVSVRVVAPIPGRDTVGVEVPNAERQIVVMRELLEQFGRADHLAIPLFLGKDVAGEPIVEDLARMPHLLIAGTTGSGKSVCINTILLSILMTRTPQQVRLVLIDPKMVELQSFKAVPHLACDIVTNMKKAPGVLDWAVQEMEKRYALFNAVGVNHIKLFHKLGHAELEKRLQRPVELAEAQLPYMVIVIDELADLIAVAQQEVEESIQRLAQKSRSVGLHVILATQRPSTDVITGVIKANLPSQIAFKVSRKIDSRVILDANGADKLLGHGDMLFVPPGGQQLTRAQGTYVSDEEIRRVVEYLEQNGPKPSYLPDLIQTEGGARRALKDQDDLYEQAVEIILGQQRGSATLLQRALAVGYTRATRLLEMMEQDGLVGAFQGSKSREVTMTLEEWKAREAQIKEELAQVDAEGDAAAAVATDEPEEAPGDEGEAAAGDGDR